MEHMINYNGEILASKDSSLSLNNRAFKYGDALFETMKVVDQNVVFLEDHYFRLMASLRMLRMDIPMTFDMTFFENSILKVVAANNYKTARCRMSVWRNDGGLYQPDSNEFSFVVEAYPLLAKVKNSYEVDLFRDYFVNSGLLSSIKTTNKLTNVLAGIYAKENGFDNCILLNERKQVVETINGNLFMITGNKIVTPPITDGCIKGIVRKKLLETIAVDIDYKFEEASISPFDLQKADELFMTNSIIGIQPITKYKKKKYLTEIVTELDLRLKQLI